VFAAPRKTAVNARGSGRTPAQRLRSQLDEKRRGNGAASGSGHGATVASFALWNLESLLLGRCESPGVAPAHLNTGADDESGVILSSLRRFSVERAGVVACRARRTTIPGVRNACAGDRPTLFTFIAAASQPSLLPPPVVAVLDANPQLRVKLARAQSAHQIVVATDEVVARVRAALAPPGDTEPAQPALAVAPADAATFAALLAAPDPLVVGFAMAVAAAPKAADDAAANEQKAGGASVAAAAQVTLTALRRDSAQLRARMLDTLRFAYEPGAMVRLAGIARGGSDVSVVVSAPRPRPAVAAKEGSGAVVDADEEEIDDEES
jgi:hypothetical protein